MKESSFQVKAEGLRKWPSDVSDIEYLRNLVPRDRCWHCPPAMAMFDVGVDGVEFPFPQLFRGETSTFVCLEDRIGILNETLQAVSWMSLDIAADGGPWHFCDWGPGYVFTNATNTVYSLREKFFPYAHAVTRTTSKFSCCADHFGRLIYATGNEVSWSSHNADDIRSIVGTEERTADVRERREFGSVTMPWRGDVLAIKPLGDGVAIYGEDGISVIRPRHETRSYDLPIINGLTQGVGIAGPLAIVGDESVHFFVGTDRRTWTLSANGVAQQILSQEFIAGMTSPVLTRDVGFSEGVNEDDLWIVDASTSYCLTKYGLGGPMDLAPYAIVIIGGSTVLRTGRNYNAGDAVTVEIRAGIRDFGEGGRMHLSVIQVGSNGLRLIRAGAQHRFSTLESWRAAHMRPCGKSGWARVRTTGVQVKPVVAGTVADVRYGATIHRVEIRYLLTDKRGRRGTKIYGGAGRVMEEE